MDCSFRSGAEDMRAFGWQFYVERYFFKDEPHARINYCLLQTGRAYIGAAAPVYMLAAWRWGVEWPSGELSYD